MLHRQQGPADFVFLPDYADYTDLSFLIFIMIKRKLVCVSWNLKNKRKKIDLLFSKKIKIKSKKINQYNWRNQIDLPFSKKNQNKIKKDKSV
jgi:hypothetical protein